jgi:anti-sigma factor RsiW
MKRSVALAGKRYEPSAELRAKTAKNVASSPQFWLAHPWKIIAIPAVLLLIASVGVNLYVGHERTKTQRVYSELADLHVAALASASPVDVVSTDRHTVKPWFQRKIPFTFNLPELQGTEFTLVGGRVTYLAQTPGGHLIYQVRKHEISVFIFQDREGDTIPSGSLSALSFNVENWRQNGLRYFVVGDVSGDDIQALSKLLRNAG